MFGDIIFPTAIAAFAFQAAVILADEYFFHRRRFLPKWELIGHPIDTFCLLIFLIALQTLSRESVAGQLMVAVAGLVSCLVITKDEWVHKQHSTGTENWLHALL